MKIFIINIAIVFCANICLAQVDIEIIISGQNELNTFESVDSIFDGSLSLYGNIYDLSPLAKIIEITGNLSINGCDNLIDLKGMENLKKIGNLLSIQNCNNLLSLSGFSNLKEIGGMFRLTGNRKLNNLKGLDGLINFRHLELNRTYLENLTGLNCIQQIGSMGIHDNFYLKDFEGLEPINSFAQGTVEIRGNKKLESLKGLENVENLGKKNNLYIRYNSELHSIEHINSIDYNSISNYAIAGNPNLCNCNIKSLTEYIIYRKTAEIKDNGYGCNSINEIMLHQK